MRIKTLLAAFLFLVLCNWPVAAGVRDAWSAYLAGRYSEAIEQLRALAEQGDPDAEYRLGTAYSDGLGVPRDYRTAAMWYERAATQGHPEAEFTLGFLSYEGAGEGENAFSSDPAKAAVYLTRAAQHGNAMALPLLCSLTQEEKGLASKDSDDALEICMQAANRASVPAQHHVGMILASRDDPASRIEAYKWLLLAANKGSLGAADSLSNLSALLNAQQIASAESAARAWRPRN